MTKVQTSAIVMGGAVVLSTVSNFVLPAMRQIDTGSLRVSMVIMLFCAMTLGAFGVTLLLQLISGKIALISALVPAGGLVLEMTFC